jgi:hypothetical protein
VEGIPCIIFDLTFHQQSHCYYITFQCSHINPRSIESYLSGICNNLEPFFPEVQSNHASALVKHTLKGALHCHGQPTKWKVPLTTTLLQSIFNSFTSANHDDMFFLSMLNTGFPGLLRLGEMAISNNPQLRNFRKVVLQNLLEWVGNDYEFLLPAHKTNTSFEGNRVHIAKIIGAPDPRPIMQRYISSRDQLFPLHPQLWLWTNGTFPTHWWFLQCLRQFCPPNIAGQSICAGGATALAEAGAPADLIHGAGHWTLNAFERYL